MLRTLLFGAAATAIAIGCGRAGAQTPVPPSPQDFVMAASQSDQYEILAAHVAVVEGQDPRVRAFAEEVIRDHSRLADDLRRAAVASGLPVPGPGMSSDQAALLSGLQGVRGAEFDRTYARQQDLVHTQAAAIEESFAGAGADPNLREAAQSALPTIRDHLSKARQLRAEVGGN